MKNNSEYQVGEFLFRFYRKRTTSFLAKLYKAGITGSAKDIHGARLDAKKIMAILDLLRIVSSKKGNDPGYEQIFKKLYNASGRIREIQVNRILLMKPDFVQSDFTAYSHYLVQKEKEQTHRFLKIIRKFDEKKLAKAEKKIKKVFYELTARAIQTRIDRYIPVKLALIRSLFEKGNDEENLHEVRQHLKELSTVLALVYSFRPSGKYERTILVLNRMEAMIGNWHDRVVLSESLHIFLENSKNLSEIQLFPAREFYQLLSEKNKTEVEDVIRDVKQIMMTGLPVEEREIQPE